MDIRIAYLTEYLLRPLGAVCRQPEPTEVSIDTVQLLAEGTILRGRVLYIGTASQLPHCRVEAAEPFLLLCAEGEPIPEEIRKNRCVVLLTCPAGTAVPTMFNSIAPLFSLKLETFDSLQEFLGRIAASDGFRRLMSSVQSIIGCSCAVLTQGLKLLGCAEQKGAAPSTIWSAMLRKGYYPNPNTSELYSARELMVYDPAGRKFETEAEKFPVSGEALYPLRSEDSSHELLGFLYFSYQDRETISANRYAIQFIAYALAFRMWRYIHSPVKNSSSICFLLKDIMSGAVLKEEDIAQKLADSHFALRENTRAMLIYTSGMGTKKYSWEHLKTVFGQLWPDDVLFTYNGDILLLLSSSQGRELQAEKLEALTAELRSYDCYAGISEGFDTIDRTFKNIYIRMLAAAKTAKDCQIECRYACYSEVALLHVARESAAVMNTRNLCNPRILKLLEYDRLHSSDYIFTLQCYWHFNLDVQSTCDYLFIHRNTLFYRLKKIKEIAGLDFRNPRHLTEFELTFAILIAAKDLPYHSFPPGINREGGDN